MIDLTNPALDDIWREPLNTEGDTVWWKWNGKSWEHVHDNITLEHTSEQSHSPE